MCNHSLIRCTDTEALQPHGTCAFPPHTHPDTIAKSVEWARSMVCSCKSYRRHWCMSGMYLSSARCSPTPLLPPRQSMHLRLMRMDRGDPAIRRRRQLLVLHHVAACCLRPVAYRDVFTRDLSTANSLRWQPALDLDFALALHARRLPGLSIRLSHSPEQYVPYP